MTTIPHENPAHNMVLGQLYTNDIRDPRILQAMAEIPREEFVPEHLRGAAYVDEDLEIAPGRSLIAPLTFAKLLDLAQITPACRVLNIGCLAGYTAAIIARLSVHIVATDTGGFISQARGHTKHLGHNVHLETVGSLADGYGMSAPYNAIVIGGAVEFIPETLAAQLAEGGRLVTVRNVAGRPDSNAGLGKGLLVEKIDGKLQYREHFDAACALLPGFKREAAFIF